MAGRWSDSPAHEHVTTGLAWQDFPEVIWSMPLLQALAATPLPSGSGLPRASPGGGTSPSHSLPDACHSQNSESGVSAAGPDLADVS